MYTNHLFSRPVKKSKQNSARLLDEDGAGYQKSGHSCADGSLPLVMAVAHPAAEGGVRSVFFLNIEVSWLC